MARLDLPNQIFSLGDIAITRAAAAACPDREKLLMYLSRHATGDWGVVAAEDRDANNWAVRDGYRILSAYPLDARKLCAGYGPNTIWVITEADRSLTTFLLPEDY